MPRKRGAGAVPKQTIEAFFPRTPEQVWRAVTDPIYWDWPNGPGTVHEPRDGPIIVTEDWGLTEEMLTVFWAGHPGGVHRRPVRKDGPAEAAAPLPAGAVAAAVCGTSEESTEDQIIWQNGIISPSPQTCRG